jgi:hypothetical protein
MSLISIDPPVTNGPEMTAQTLVSVTVEAVFDWRQVAY